MYFGFGMGFGVIGLLSSLIFVMAFALVIVSLIRSLKQWNRNNHSPRLSVSAIVVSKRIRVNDHIHTVDTHHHHHTSTTYYVTFEVESTDRMEFIVSGSEYGLLQEGDEGVLNFQGTRYLGFERF